MYIFFQVNQDIEWSENTNGRTNIWRILWQRRVSFWPKVDKTRFMENLTNYILSFPKSLLVCYFLWNNDRSCQPANSFVVPQMNLLQNNTSNNPTLLVSEILEQNSLSQNNMGLNLGSEAMNKTHVTSSLLPPSVRNDKFKAYVIESFLNKWYLSFQ